MTPSLCLGEDHKEDADIIGKRRSAFSMGEGGAELAVSAAPLCVGLCVYVLVKSKLYFFSLFYQLLLLDMGKTKRETTNKI